MMSYVYVPMMSHRSYPDDWHTIHDEKDEMFEKPLYAMTLAEAEKLISKEKKAFSPSVVKEFNFKIERMPQDALTTFRKKKGSKAKPKRKPVKKTKSCGCK